MAIVRYNLREAFARRAVTLARPHLATAIGCVALLSTADAHALDLPKIDKIPVKLEVTEASFLVQRFNPRTLSHELQGDGYFGYWVNRLNLALSWWRLTVGTRLDSSVWWREPNWVMPDDTAAQHQSQQDQVGQDSYRFPQTIYPAKLWVTYNAPGVEVTLGDAYVQFARGLVTSMRKLDDLGIDTTVRGGKIAITKGPFAVTAVAGVTNPARVDEATGSMLFLQRDVSSRLDGNRPVDSTAPNPVFGSDGLVAGEIQAGRGLPIVLATSASRYTRCAPYAYDASGKIIPNGLRSEFGGVCDGDSVQKWMNSIHDSTATRNATEIDVVAQSVEVPKLGHLGSIYVVGAIQRRHYDFNPDLNGASAEGNAIYGSYSGSYGPVTNTFEFKSYRNFRPVLAGVNSGRAGAFAFVSYATPPTTEVLTQDNLGTNDFNACVTGGRLRTDIRMSKHLLTYVQGIYEVTKSEQSGTTCDKNGDVTGVAAARPDFYTNYVWDGTAGIQFDWDEGKSYVYALANARNDVHGTGERYLQQSDMEYTVSLYLGKGASKALHGGSSLEFTGRNRHRYWEDENKTGGKPFPWFEGENYVALKVAPKWVFTAGMEYTSRTDLPNTYFNGSVIYKFNSASNLKVFAGQQRGGLKCISGVCRIFPAFDGARLELTVRF